MIKRSLVASIILLGPMLVSPAGAQVLLCPEAPRAPVEAGEVSAEAERLLSRLVIALDLHGHRGISVPDILELHAETPSALLAKLTNVTDQCVRSSADLETFHQSLPELRKAFLEATDIVYAAAEEGAAEDPSITPVALKSNDAARVEQSIDLSVRELWRKLWFRPAGNSEGKAGRWAVIVASPADADSGWDSLAEHQRRWTDAFFELHEPYYETNPHHAIVVGRRLPRDQAVRLRDYAIEIGMADDSYIWALPADDTAEAAAADLASAKDEDAEVKRDDEGLDLSILEK